LKSAYLVEIIGVLVRTNLAVYEPAKQTRAVLLYWRLPEEWAEVLHEWVRARLPNPPLYT
jgi:ESCRT-II complex subunit VPS25